MWFVVLYLFEGLLFIGLSLPLIKRRVKPNHLYGFRTPKTMSDPDIWYPANEYSGRTLFAAGIAITVCSLLLAPLNLFGPTAAALYSCVMVGVMLIGLLWSVIASLQYLKRL